MANLRLIRRRVRSVRKTQQITRAMKLVAAAKLKRAQEAALRARPYAAKVGEVIASLAARAKPELSPLLQVREAVRRAELVVLTSDRGLCGAFNLNVFRRVEEFLKESRGRYEGSTLTLVGRKGRDYFRHKAGAYGAEIGKELIRVAPDYPTAAALGEELVQRYLEGAADELWLVFNEFRSVISQRPVIRKLLPITPMAVAEGTYLPDYLYEPSAGAILNELLPRHLYLQLYQGLLESTAGELGARMSAMDNATRNAGEMIERLTLRMNKARQEGITKELMDIVTGAEALK